MIQKGIPFHDVATDPRFEYPQQAIQKGIVSAAFVPLIARGQAIGVLRAYTGEEHSFSSAEIEFVTALANLGALAIANARLYQICIRDQRMTGEALWHFRLPKGFGGFPEPLWETRQVRNQRCPRFPFETTRGRRGKNPRKIKEKEGWAMRDSNPRPHGCKPCALTS